MELSNSSMRKNLCSRRKSEIPESGTKRSWLRSAQAGPIWAYIEQNEERPVIRGS